MIRVRFTALHIITTLLRIMAFLQVLSVVLLIVVARKGVPDALMRQGQNFTVFVVTSSAALVCSMIVAIGLFALAELLTCFMAIEANTRQGTNAILNLQAVVRTSIEEQTQILAQSPASRSDAQTGSQGTCPKCGVRFRVTENVRGQQVACPKCGAKFVA